MYICLSLIMFLVTGDAGPCVEAANEERAQTVTLVALLEDWALEEPETFKEVFREQVRAAFVSEDGKWLPFSPSKFHGRTLPPMDKWYAVRDGCVIGQVTTNGLFIKESNLSEMSVKLLTSSDLPEDTAPRSWDFARWGGVTVKKPLVLLSTPTVGHCGDWHRTDLIGPISEEIAEIFRSKVSSFYPPEYEDKRAKEERVLDRISVSTLTRKESLICENGWRLDGVCLGSEALKSAEVSEFLEDSVPPEYLMLGIHWFVTKPGARTVHLGYSMVLLDFGDFDGDGVCDFVFQAREYAKDGYVLFSHNFEERVDFLWRYH